MIIQTLKSLKTSKYFKNTVTEILQILLKHMTNSAEYRIKDKNSKSSNTCFNQN